MARKHYEPLQVPPIAQKEGGLELVRAAVVEQGLGLSIRRGFDDPAAWGVLLAGIAHEVVRIYAKEMSLTEADAMAKIAGAFNEEIRSSAYDPSPTPTLDGGGT